MNSREPTKYMTKRTCFTVYAVFFQICKHIAHRINSTRRILIKFFAIVEKAVIAHLPY